MAVDFWILKTDCTKLPKLQVQDSLQLPNVALKIGLIEHTQEPSLAMNIDCNANPTPKLWTGWRRQCRLHDLPGRRHGLLVSQEYLATKERNVKVRKDHSIFRQLPIAYFDAYR